MAGKFQNLKILLLILYLKKFGRVHEDKKDLAETKVRLVREAQEHLAKVKGKFHQGCDCCSRNS